MPLNFGLPEVQPVRRKVAGAPFAAEIAARLDFYNLAHAFTVSGFIVHLSLQPAGLFIPILFQGGNRCFQPQGDDLLGIKKGSAIDLGVQSRG